ncbi:MAG: ABC transporter permease [Desulfobacterales bacterium]|nr:ABC transporter permease [Desulfobacterales bacterium]MCP4160743.1 ABC transporter permease [Deltaproteobacteria bacterium]
MGTTDINALSLTYFLIFLVPFVFVCFKVKLNIVNKVIYSVVRMVIQLSFVGIYLKYIFDYNQPLINILYILIMITVATFSILNSTKLKIRNMFMPVFCSILIPVSVMLLFFNNAIISINNIFDAKYLVTIGGMLLGNSLSGNIIALDNFYSDIKKNEKIYLYSISLGGTRIQALAPFFRKSIIASINPIVASMATIGLVALPGMMSGQILGGSSPAVAIKYQIAIMLAIFFTQFFSVNLSILFSIKMGFNDFDILKTKIFN